MLTDVTGSANRSKGTLTGGKVVTASQDLCPLLRRAELGGPVPFQGNMKSIGLED